MDFEAFPKVARWSRPVVITEKLDGTNAQVCVVDKVQGVDYSKAVYDDGAVAVLVGSRTRWITPDDDNYGFARWAYANRDVLLGLGPGRHFGEWWGRGIQRNYGLKEKRFSLFNVGRWYDPKDCAGEDLGGRTAVPECCHVVPILAKGPNEPGVFEAVIQLLRERGSLAAPGFMNPEGAMLFHTAAGIVFKKTLVKDEAPKSQVAA